jgi:flagellar basal-body rod protein FlgF
MDSTTHVAVSLATAMRRSLDVTANNIANAGTTGFKAERVALEMYSSGTGGSDYVFDAGSYVDIRQGAMTTTGNPLDMALTGPGWLAFETSDGRIGYGRDGSLALDADGNVVSVAGERLLDADGVPIVLPPDSGAIEIAADGTITSADGGQLARVGVFDLDAPDALERIAGGLLSAPSGTADGARPAEGTTILQGAVEGSNVEPVLEMVGLMEIQRAYERATQVIRTHDELARDAIRRAGRTS